jgi:hypothetical protein
MNNAHSVHNILGPFFEQLKKELHLFRVACTAEFNEGSTDFVPWINSSYGKVTFIFSTYECVLLGNLYEEVNAVCLIKDNFNCNIVSTEVTETNYSNLYTLGIIILDVIIEITEIFYLLSQNNLDY